ncbi:tRNA pseudouridine synthase A [Symbiodinium microadriaticum]|uniref:tRNA pseudouridine synthase n=1 Tax=Symbiodinium microadriaticum TaxID=2951 RepID=A0A1Q9DLJ4_SYMMI|nr:tRNA pseudouridine synthase A [Symbiodinium microadriaticum]
MWRLLTLLTLSAWKAGKTNARRQPCMLSAVVLVVPWLAFAKMPAERSPEAAERRQYGDLLRLVKKRAWPQKIPELATDKIGVDEAADGEDRRSLVSPGFRRIRFRAAYDGSQYNGWARVKNASPLTVAGMVDRAVSLLLRRKTFSCGASRTDAGVHAQGQAAHFDVPDWIATERRDDWRASWEQAVNEQARGSCWQCCKRIKRKLGSSTFPSLSQLPSDIRVWNFQDAPPDFHATFSASGKTYVLTLFGHDFCHAGMLMPLAGLSPPLRIQCSRSTGKVLQVPDTPWLGRADTLPRNPACGICGQRQARTFDSDLLQQAASKLVGEKDFAYFTQASKLDKYRMSGTVRTIHGINVVEDGPGRCRIEVNLDGAIYRMVRNIVGCIVMAACGRLALERIDELLQVPPDKAKQETSVPVSAFPCLPPHGLCLEKVHYDSQDF